MIKEIIRNLAYFAILAVIFSGFTACSGDGNEAVSADPASKENEGPKQNPADSDSPYPMLATSLSKAPFETEDGSTFTVEDRRGKVLLLNLWGIWCVPCRVEMPHLAKLQEEYRENGLQVIGLNVGDDDLEPEDFGKMKEFAEKLKLNYELVRITNKTSKDFAQAMQFGGVPLTVLVDREGRMRGVFKGASQSEIKKMSDTVSKIMVE